LNIILKLPTFENSYTGDDSYIVNIYFFPAETHKKNNNNNEKHKTSQTSRPR